MKFLLSLFLLGVFGSALALVVVRHENRLLFTELQTLQAQRDNLDIEWGRLQLEHSTLADPVRIEKLAREKLDLSLPPPEAVVVIHLPATSGNAGQP